MSSAEDISPSDTLFFSIKTIGLSTYGGRKPQSLRDAIRHNRREIQAELGARSDIDCSRTRLNQTIAGPPTSHAVVLLAEKNMAEAGYTPPRRDYTQAYEFVFSLPRATSIDVQSYFSDCLQWTKENFGVEVVLSADIHRDQDLPHLHLLLSPIRNGTYEGSKLITKQELEGLRKSFAVLALSYGLKEPVKMLRGESREVAARLVLTHLKNVQDPILESSLWSTLRVVIDSSPARFAAHLGINLPEPEVPEKKMRTSTQILTSKGKGGNTERKQKPIGFETTAIKERSKPIGLQDVVACKPRSIETIALLVSPKNHSVALPEQIPEAASETGQQLRSESVVLAADKWAEFSAARSNGGRNPYASVLGNEPVKRKTLTLAGVNRVGVGKVRSGEYNFCGAGFAS